MRRRTVLAGVAALAAGSGCARAVGSDPVTVRVKRPTEDRLAGADERCVLRSSFVEDHPVLERVLSSAKTAPRGEWVTTGTSRKVGEALAADLRSHCEHPGSLYVYGDAAYVVRVTEDDRRLLLEGSARSEAIRGLAPDDTV
ncbi:MAG: hypothetical protein ABEJ88_04105 [Halobacterium sp.]